MEFYQHGDVLIKRIERIPSDAKKIEGNVIAEGEATGHAHRATAATVTLWMLKDRLFIEAPDGSPITHEEHKTRQIDPGEFEVYGVREYDHLDEMERRVID